MLTYWLQWAIAACSFAFAVVAIRVYRATAAGSPVHAAAWKLSGIAFFAHALVQSVQYAWGGLAMWRTEAPGIMEAYLRWAPAMNHSRTSLLLFFCVALSVFAVRGTVAGPRYWPLYGAGLAGALLVGAVVGALEGPLLGSRHYGVVAGGDAVELVVLLGALLIAVTRDRLDRYLWGALAVYAFSVALSILWFAALSQIDTPGAWTPPPWVLAAYRAVARGAMAAFAIGRLRLARSGGAASGMLPDAAHPVATFAR
jgi:hypothetical protein